MTNLIYANDDNFEEQVVNSDLPVIVDFFADWCMPCQMMGPVFEELSSEYEGKLKFAKVDTEKSPAISSHLGIRSLPTLAILKDKKEVARFMGFMDKDALKEKIDSILSKL
jgi:thioredoxin 1